MDSPDSKPEVRRCSKCQQVTLVRVSSWGREFAGLELGAYAADYRCESCGYALTLQAWKRIRAHRVFGYVFRIAIFPGLWFLWQARAWERAHLENPLVDAPVPVINSRVGPGDRRCGRCGHRALLTSMRRHAFGVVRGGLEFGFACECCGFAFKTASPGGLVFWIVAGVLTASLTIAIFVNARTVRDQIVFGGFFALLTVFTFGSFVARIRAARHNPET